MALSRNARRAIAKQRKAERVERTEKRAIAYRNTIVADIVKRNLNGPRPSNLGNIRSSLADLETAAPAGKPRNWHKQGDGTVGNRGLKSAPMNDKAILTFKAKVAKQSHKG